MSANANVLNSASGLPPLVKPVGRMTDILWLLLVLGTGLGGLYAFKAHMDVYEVSILVGSVAALAAVGWYWRGIRGLSIAVAVLTAIALWRYGVHFGDQLSVGREALAAAQNKDFFLKFLVSSQSAIMWISTWKQE